MTDQYVLIDIGIGGSVHTFMRVNDMLSMVLALDGKTLLSLSARVRLKIHRYQALLRGSVGASEPTHTLDDTTS